MKRKQIIDGMKDSTPIIFGYAPLGIALGIMANAIAFTWYDMLGMSAIVFAGSAQFIGIDMINSGSAIGAIIATTFFVNFRHFLMSTAYSPYFRNTKTSVLLLISFGITDESFAIGINKCKHDSQNATPAYILALNITAYISWILFTVIGIFLGGVIPDYERLGLGFALSAMFIGLISLMIEDKKGVVICLLSGILSLCLLLLGVKSWNVIIGAIVSCVVVVSVGDYYGNK